MSAPTLPPGLRERVMASRASTPFVSRAEFRRRIGVSVAVGLLWLSGTFVLLGLRPDWTELPARYALGALGLVAASAAALTALGVSRGKSMLGPPVGLLLVALAALPLALAAFFAAFIAPGPSSITFSSHHEALRSSLGCHALSLILAAPVLGAMVWLKRGLTLAAPGLLGACLGGAAGAWAHMVVHAHCPISDGMHILAGHVLPMLPMMLLGGLAGYRALR
jgi:hypothetical protein